MSSRVTQVVAAGPDDEPHVLPPHRHELRPPRLTSGGPVAARPRTGAGGARRGGPLQAGRSPAGRRPRAPAGTRRRCRAPARSGRCVTAPSRMGRSRTLATAQLRLGYRRAAMAAAVRETSIAQARPAAGGRGKPAANRAVNQPSPHPASTNRVPVAPGSWTPAIAASTAPSWSVMTRVQERAPAAQHPRRIAADGRRPAIRSKQVDVPGSCEIERVPARAAVAAIRPRERQPAHRTPQHGGP